MTREIFLTFLTVTKIPGTWQNLQIPHCISTNYNLHKQYIIFHLFFSRCVCILWHQLPILLSQLKKNKFRNIFEPEFFFPHTLSQLYKIPPFLEVLKKNCSPTAIFFTKHNIYKSKKDLFNKNDFFPNTQKTRLHSTKSKV